MKLVQKSYGEPAYKMEGWMPSMNIAILLRTGIQYAQMYILVTSSIQCWDSNAWKICITYTVIFNYLLMYLSKLL
jgi:hypothetical protein